MKKLTNETAAQRSYTNQSLIDAGLALLPALTGVNYTGIEMARIEKLGMHQRPPAAVAEAVKAAVQARRGGTVQ